MKNFLGIVFIVVVFVSAIEVVVAQHQVRKLFVEIQGLQQVRDELNEEWGRLQLEQSTWATDDRIESLARMQLGMIEPDTNSLILLLQ
ncbi:MAG: cell division protein FtsL [Proteobacteria bacterium]|nr:cell division protein FtsL [Pseudomonadota bacterium]MCZ6525597.1 cell division protein FtsL [Gammaproteobacteria bacterium]